MNKTQENITRHQYNISRNDRNRRNGHNSFLIWFTGLSGSGKSTIANELEKALFERNIHTFSLDGDNIRSGINKGLTFSEEDRNENQRRVAELGKLFIEAGMVTIVAFISPLKKDRELAKEIVGADSFIEVFVNTSLEECEKRDVKGLYKKARAGEIQNFTGISAPYEAPEKPDIEIYTEKESVEEAVQKILNKLEIKLKLD